MRQNVHPRQLTQTPLEFVSLRHCESKFRHHNSNADVSDRRIESLGVEQARSNSLTGAQEPLDVSGARYPSSSRKA